MSIDIKGNDFDRDEMISFLRKNYFNDNINILEVGTHSGNYAERIYQIFPKSSIYLLDTWDSNNTDFYYSTRPGLVEKAYAMTLEKFKDKPNVNIIKADSVVAYKEFQDNFFDWIYIDGDHSYDGVKNDLQNWFKKLKINGIMSGHDWDVNSSNPEFEKFGVQKALTEFLEDFNNSIQLNLTNEINHKSWFFINK
jgi:hypothetical protein